MGELAGLDTADTAIGGFDDGGVDTRTEAGEAAGEGPELVLVDSFKSRLDAASAKDPQAIRELVEEFQSDLTSYARRQGMADPEGVANTALFGALQNLDGFKGDDRRTFRGYLYRILRRRVVDEIRYRSARPRVVGGLEQAEIGVGLIDETSSGFDERIADEDYVDHLLTRLTPEQRQILEMRLLHDLSIQETADRTGRSVPAVKAMQRRAIVSLRVAVAASVILALVLALRLLMSPGDERLLVENGPAGPGGGLSLSAPADEDASTADAEAPGLPVAGEPEGEAGDGADTIIAGASSQTADAPEDTAEGEGSGGDGQAGSDTAEGEPADQAPGPSDGDGGVDEAPVQIPTTPCHVRTDGSPAVGEIAFVTYDFSGPYRLFRGTSVTMIGRSGASSILTAFGNVDSVSDGRSFPFAITPNMFNDNDRFVPRSSLVGGSLKTNCTVSRDRVADGGRAVVPCNVVTDGSPEAGEEVTVTYRMAGAHDQLNGRWTYILGSDDKSALSRDGERRGGSREVNEGTELTFILDETMWVDGELDIRSVFRSGEGFIRCSVDA